MGTKKTVVCDVFVISNPSFYSVGDALWDAGDRSG